MEIVNVDKEAMIYQSNEVVEANYKLTTAEQKLVLALISLIDRDKEDFESIRVNANSLAEACGFTSKAKYSQLDQTFKKLASRLLSLRKRYKDRTSEYNTHWVQAYEYVKYHDDKKEGMSYIEFEMDDRLRPHFLQLKDCFLKTNLQTLISFSHIYSIRFYMIFRNRMKIGHIRLSFEEIRKLMELDAPVKSKSIKPKYTNMVNFKNRVIKHSIEEINNNKNCDITVEYKYYRNPNSRAYAGVDFTFSYREKNKTSDEVSKPALPELTEEQQELKQKLVGYDVPDEQAAELVSKYDCERIERNIGYSLEHATTNLGKYLLNSIEKDYAMSAITTKEIKEREQERKETEVKEKNERQKATIREELNKQNEEYVHEITKFEIEQIKARMMKGEDIGDRMRKRLEYFELTPIDVLNM